jgi:hypothetical protein
MARMPQPATIKGYHGTDAAVKDRILREGFYCCTQRKFLGEGVYFFVAGISAQGPVKDAIKWAHVCVNCFGSNYRQWAVLEAEIKTEKMLDLTDRETAINFNGHRDQIYFKYTFKPRHGDSGSGESLLDVEILEEILKEIECNVVKSDFFFKFTVENRKHIESRLPNVTIICVYAPKEALASVRTHQQGPIR